MREIFSSPRLENVEQVAALLRDAGIEVRIHNARSYKGNRRGNFSYTEAPSAQTRPSVWVIRSEDQTKARQLMRDAGLLQSPRMPVGSFLADTPHAGGGDPKVRKPASRFKVLLLVAIAVLGALAFAGLRNVGKDTPDAPRTAAPRSTLPPVQPDPVFVIATPPALAATLFAAELRDAGTSRACLSIDGEDPPADVLALSASAVARSVCGDPADGDLRIDVARYRTDGSGVGEVDLVVQRGTGAPDTRVLEVARTGADWQVTGGD